MFVFSFLVLLKKIRMRDRSRISSFCFGFGSGVSQRDYEEGGRVGPRFPFATPVAEGFFSDLLRAVMSYWAELYLKLCQTSTTERFCENSQQPKIFDYFRKEAPPLTFNWILNVPPI